MEINALKARLIDQLTSYETLKIKVEELTFSLYMDIGDPKKLQETILRARQLYQIIFQRTLPVFEEAIARGKRNTPYFFFKGDYFDQVRVMIPILRKLADLQQLSEYEKAAAKDSNLEAGRLVRDYLKFEEMVGNIQCARTLIHKKI